jgi:putative phosphoribosyl transferase
VFADRRDAGQQLAERIAALELPPPVLVVGLPRGGVPVAAEVARRLDAPLDVVLVRKVGVPGHRELAMGALGEGEVLVRSDDVIAAAGVGADEFEAAVAIARAELVSQVDRFRTSAARRDVAGRTVVVVDDGVATGATARAACAVLRVGGAARIVLAVPVAPPRWDAELGDVADEYVAVETPARFGAVGVFYDDFSETSDAEVISAIGTGR